MIKYFLVLILFILPFGYTNAQDSRSIGDNTSAKKKTLKLAPEQYQRVLNAFNNHPYTKYYDRLIVEYGKRMKANVRKYKVMARKMEKPQYSDPLYFGHKRKPKKRPVGKRKFCNECGIVH